MAVNQTEWSRWEERSVIKCLVTADQRKFTDYVMWAEKPVLVKKIYTNGLNISLSRQVYVKKTVNRVETHWWSGKENSVHRGQ